MENKEIKVNGRTLEVVEEMDMTKYPNTAKRVNRQLAVKGPRNAFYMLTEYKGGAWFCMSLQGARVERNCEVIFS